MNYYNPVPCDNTVKKPYVANSEFLSNYDEWNFVRGDEFSHWEGAIWVKAKTTELDGEPDDVLQTRLFLPIYSSRLQKALKDAGIKGIQFLPIKVFKSDGSEIKGYAIANVLNLLPALDEDKSKFTLFGNVRPDKPNDIMSIEKMVIHKSVVEKHDIFRLRSYPLALLVSDKFKKIFEDNKFTGYSFPRVELSD